MRDIVTRLIQPIVKIRHEEWPKALLMFLYFAFSMATLYILKPVRSAQFLTIHGAENLPYAFMGEFLFLTVFTFAYVKMSRWFTNRNVLFSIATIFFISIFLVFWFLFKGRYLVDWLAYFFYFWVAAYSITITTQGWTLANDIFNPQEAKRLFGFIISGASLGGMIGGLVTNRFAERLGTENLLLLAAGLLTFCVYFINAIWQYEKVGEKGEALREEVFSETAHLKEKSTWQLFFGSRYLLLIAALVMVAKASSSIVDIQFNSVVEISVIEKNARTAFFGGFSALLNFFSFILQLVVASYALRHLGIGISLLLLPIGLCFGAGATVFWTVLSVSGITKVYDLGMNYSINQLGKEILYLPIASDVRYRVKPVIDMLAFRGSKGMAGVLVKTISPLLGIPGEKLGILVLLLAPLWILAAWAVRDEYTQSIKRILLPSKEPDESLRPTAREAMEVLAHLEGERSFEKLKELLFHRSSITRKMSAAACFAFYSSARDVRRVRKLVEEMIRYEALELKGIEIEKLFHEDAPHRGSGIFDRELAALLKAKGKLPIDFRTLLRQRENEILLKVSACLNDPHEEVRTKRKAILLLSTLGTQGAADILLNALASVRDRSLRFNLIRAMNRIRAKTDQLAFNSLIVKKEVVGEIRDYKSIRTAVEEYKQRKRVARPEEDYLLAALQAMDEECLERIFRLLALLYDSEMVHIIYDRLVDLESDKHVKANAVELLENVVEPELTRALSPVLDGVQWAEMEKEILEEVIRDFLESQDRWLTVCAVFLIVELHLDQFYSILTALAQDRISIVREAAEIALMKTEQRD